MHGPRTMTIVYFGPNLSIIFLLLTSIIRSKLVEFGRIKTVCASSSLLSVY